MTDTINQADPVYRKYIPVVTVFCCLVSIALFFGINSEGKLDNYEVYMKWGAPSVFDIFNGHLWGLITSNFLHLEVWHIAFNIYWFWIFGKKLEFENTKLFYVLFILSSALASSLGQLSISDSNGIGLSGIVYAQFGYIFYRGKTTNEYKDVLDKRTSILFFVWLIICIILTQTNTLLVANGGHFGGLLWGLLIAYLVKYSKSVQWTVGLIYLTISAAFVLYSPFSTAYLSSKAYELHKNNNVNEAIDAYRKILEINPASEFAKVNLRQLEIYQLSEKASKLVENHKENQAILIYQKILDLDPSDEFAKNSLMQIKIRPLMNRAFELHAIKNYKEARKVYYEILTIDKGNKWAMENLSKLPVE